MITGQSGHHKKKKRRFFFSDVKRSYKFYLIILGIGFAIVLFSWLPYYFSRDYLVLVQRTEERAIKAKKTAKARMKQLSPHEVNYLNPAIRVIN